MSWDVAVDWQVVMAEGVLQRWISRLSGGCCGRWGAADLRVGPVSGQRRLHLHVAALGGSEGRQVLDCGVGILTVQGSAAQCHTLL